MASIQARKSATIELRLTYKTMDVTLIIPTIDRLVIARWRSTLGERSGTAAAQIWVIVATHIMTIAANGK